MPDIATLPKFTGPAAWIGSELAADAGVLSLSPACLDEIARLAGMFDNNPLPTVALDPDDFELSACRGVMSQALEALKDGLGYAIIDRVPLEACSARRPSRSIGCSPV
jgi:hypothetical protein